VKRTKRAILSEINMIPMIDVMLVLVLILMLCVPLLEQNLTLALPESDSANKARTPKSAWVVSMDRKKQLAIKLPSGKQSTCSLAKLKSCLPTWPKEAPAIELRADGRLAYSDVMQVMTLLQKRGVAGLSLVYVPKR
jgi:biopolymer transport protein TolR